MTRARRFLLAALVCTAPLVARAQEWSGPADIAIEVKGKPHGSVAEALIILRYQQIEPAAGPRPVRTDSAGRAVLANLAEGLWEVEVSHPDFLSFVAVVVLESGRKPVVQASFLQASGSSLTPIRVKFADGKGRPPSPAVPLPPEAAARLAQRRPPPPAPAVEPAPSQGAGRASPPVLPEPELRPLPEAARPAPQAAAEPVGAQAAPLEPKASSEPPPAPRPTVQEPPRPAAPPAPPAAPAEPEPAPAAAAAPAEPDRRPTPPEPPPAMPEPEPTPVTPEPEPPTPQPEPAPPATRPSVPTQPEPPPPIESAAPVVTQPQAAPPAPAPSPEAPQPATAPAAILPPPGPLGPTLRSYGDGACVECRPGEWAISVETVAGPAIAPCAASLADEGRELAALLGSSIALELKEIAAPARQAIGQMGPSEPAARAAELLGDASRSCRIVAAVIPKAGRFRGLRMEAADASGIGDCQADQTCPVGRARWLGQPRVSREPSSNVIWGLFVNEATDRARRARLTVYFAAPRRTWNPAR